MELRTVMRNEAVWVEMLGALDAVGALKAQEVVRSVLTSDASSVTLDWTKLDFIDPSGVGLLVFLYKRLTSQGRKLRVLGVHGQPARLLQQLKLDNSINLAYLPDEIRPVLVPVESPVAAYGGM